MGPKKADAMFVFVYCHIPSVQHAVWHVAVFSDTRLMNEQHRVTHSNDYSVSKCHNRDGSNTIVTWVIGPSRLPGVIRDGFLQESLSHEMN